MKANIKDRKLQEFIQESRVIAENSISTEEMKEYINDLCDELEKCNNLRKFLKDANRGAERNYRLALDMARWINNVEKKAVELIREASPHRFRVTDMNSNWKISND